LTATPSSAPVRSEPPTALHVYRDDGPLARALGGVLGRALPLPAVALEAAGLVALFVVMGLGGADTALGPAAAVVGWLVLTAGAASGRPHDDRLRWAVPSLLRLGEYAGVLWLAAIAGASSVPAAFALLAAVAFRQYDLVYRLRHRAVAPPVWVGLASLGWDGRLILVWVLLAAGALPAGLYVAAGLLAVVLVGESIAGWARFGRAQRPALYEDEEEDGE
jgi:hypothetical protein